MHIMARQKHSQSNLDGAATAEALRRFLTAHNLSQKQLAEQLQTSQSTVSRLLSNRHLPDPDLRRRIANLVSDEDSSAIGTDPWVQAVVRAAKSHPDFAQLITFGLRYLHLHE
jgi:transcriptional regulator with XRE-family HTH domain